MFQCAVTTSQCHLNQDTVAFYLNSNAGNKSNSMHSLLK